LYDNTTSGFLTSESDGSTTNEGSLTVEAGGAGSSIISSNTSGSTDVTLLAGSNITLSETGNTITIASSGATDGDGIYDGNGTVPSNTVATLSNQLTFSRFNNKTIITDEVIDPGTSFAGDGPKLVLQDDDTSPEGALVFRGNDDIDGAAVYKRTVSNVGLIFEEVNGTFRFEDLDDNSSTSIRVGGFNNSQNAEIRFEDAGSDVILNHNQSSGQFIIENATSEWIKIDHSDGTIYFPQYTSSKLTTSKTGRYLSLIEPTSGEMFLIEPDSIGGSGGAGTDDQTLSWNGTTGEITIESGNTIDIDGRYVEDVNNEGIDINDYTPSNGGTITVDFESQARKIVEINTTNITSGFTMNVSNGWNTAGSAGVYNVRFYNSSANQRTVTLDATDTWYDEKGNTITTLTLESSEDKILTMYTENGSTWYTME